MDAVKEKVSSPSMNKEYCFICGGIDKENDISLFTIPSGKFSVWEKLIVKQGLVARSKLCEIHFEQSEICKGFLVGDKFVRNPRARLISKEIVPSKHLGGKLICYSNFNRRSDTLIFVVRCTPTPKRTRQALKPCILNIGSPAGEYI